MAHLPKMKNIRVKRGRRGSCIFVEFLLNSSLAWRHVDIVEIVVCEVIIKFETRHDFGGWRHSELGRFDRRNRCTQCTRCEGLRGGNTDARGLLAAIFRHLADDLDFDLTIYDQVLTTSIIKVLEHLI